MRSRNLDFYSGGVEVTEKEGAEFLSFTEGVLNRLKKLFSEK
jgi:hypothetical protein